MQYLKYDFHPTTSAPLQKSLNSSYRKQTTDVATVYLPPHSQNNYIPGSDPDEKGKTGAREEPREFGTGKTSSGTRERRHQNTPPGGRNEDRLRTPLQSWQEGGLS